MWTRFEKLPLIISVPSIFILMMMIPALHGFYSGNEHQGRTFLYAVLLGIFLIGFISFLIHDKIFSMHTCAQLWSFLIFFLCFPIILAIPLHEAMLSGPLINSYLDLVSVLTTTGLPVFQGNVLSDTIVIWRVCLGWTSGFLIWVFAWSVFTQLNLNKVVNLKSKNSGSSSYGDSLYKSASPAEKFWRESARLGPVYIGITAATALSLLVATGNPTFAILRAMSTIATFGVEIPGHVETEWSTEAILVLIMVFAISRATFSNAFSKKPSWKFVRDPEIRVAVTLIVLAVAILVSLSVSSKTEPWESIEVIWGAFFTSVSFLTTTGLTSTFFPYGLREFSQVEIVFAALAMFGGGVATTAGGIKLLRVYILAKHCKAELDHLITPSQAITSRSQPISLYYPNAILACVFLLLFILVFVAITLGLTLSGSSAGEALQLTIATLTNTGPLVNEFGGAGITIIELETREKLILVFAMVFGRMEVLALLALLNPDFYR